MGIPVIGTLLDIIKEPLNRLIPDKGKRAEFEHEITMTAMRTGLAQMEINKAEAEHPSVFVAGWRPFVGWVCGFSLLWHFMLYDILHWLQLAFMPDTPSLPALTGTETLVTVLMSMLGLGGLRTYEKMKGVSRESIKKKVSPDKQ